MIPALTSPVPEIEAVSDPIAEVNVKEIHFRPMLQEFW
jgi:hypothetical protein